MPFVGVPVVQQISDKRVRISGAGAALAASAVGTIGLFGDGGANVQLPDSFDPQQYVYGTTTLTPSDVIKCDAIPVTAVAGVGRLPFIVKTGATFGAPFRITMTNPDAVNATSEMEIYVDFHG